MQVHRGLAIKLGGLKQVGYDMMTTLSSSFIYSKQSASISNGEDVKIIGQNFGFDLENGITQVELDISNPHYYFEIISCIEE